MRTNLKTIVLAAVCTAIATLFFDSSGSKTVAARVEIPQTTETQKKLDPTVWGSTHARKPVPEYVRGDECLFCHRNDVGTTWQKNAHGVAVRHREDATELQEIANSQPGLAKLTPAIEYFLGSRRRMRFLRKDGFGNFALLNTQAVFGANGRVASWIDLERPAWDKTRFGNACAGCHATAVDSSTKTFAMYGLDCSTCHGEVTLDHTKDTSKMFLSKKRRNDAQAITSTCASCHLRGGKSQSTSLPYPNNFVAGDNLFQDFSVDLSKADDESLNAGDRHVYQNVRDVAVYGIEFPTCINCHAVHENSTLKHRRAPRTAICASCHSATGAIKGSNPYTVHSTACEY